MRGYIWFALSFLLAFVETAPEKLVSAEINALCSIKKNNDPISWASIDPCTWPTTNVTCFNTTLYGCACDSSGYVTSLTFYAEWQKGAFPDLSNFTHIQDLLRS